MHNLTLNSPPLLLMHNLSPRQGPAGATSLSSTGESNSDSFSQVAPPTPAHRGTHPEHALAEVKPRLCDLLTPFSCHHSSSMTLQTQAGVASPGPFTWSYPGYVMPLAGGASLSSWCVWNKFLNPYSSPKPNTSLWVFRDFVWFPAYVLPFQVQIQVGPTLVLPWALPKQSHMMGKTSVSYKW